MGAATLNTMMRMGEQKLKEEENEKLKAKIAENDIYVKNLELNLDVMSRRIETWEKSYKDLKEENERLEAKNEKLKEKFREMKEMRDIAEKWHGIMEEREKGAIKDGTERYNQLKERYMELENKISKIETWHGNRQLELEIELERERERVAELEDELKQYQDGHIKTLNDELYEKYLEKKCAFFESENQKQKSRWVALPNGEIGWLLSPGEEDEEVEDTKDFIQSENCDKIYIKRNDYDDKTGYHFVLSGTDKDGDYDRDIWTEEDMTEKGITITGKDLKIRNDFVYGD
jgi:chromosome segregation ATPase